MKLPRKRWVGTYLALLLTTVPVCAQNVLFIENDMVGVGIAHPTVPLHLVATNAPANTVLRLENNGAARIRIHNGATGETWNIGHQVPSGTGLVYSDVGDADSEMLLDVDGNLTITGNLTTAAGTWPDFVFDEDYVLMPLADLRTFIQDRGHLPGVPTASEVEAAGGVDMTRLQATLLSKVEELTLYTLDQEARLSEQDRRVETLVEQNRRQEALITELLRRLDETGKP